MESETWRGILPDSKRIGNRWPFESTLRQGILAAFVVIAMMFGASAILWVYWDLAVW